MKDTLYVQESPEGVGLAAPQLGYSFRLFIFRLNENDSIEVAINPEIISVSKETNYTQLGEQGVVEEGCLSVPNVYAKIERPWEIKVKYTNEQWKQVEQVFTGIEAVIFLHELDHLNGILFTQRALEQGKDVYSNF